MTITAPTLWDVTTVQDRLRRFVELHLGTTAVRILDLHRTGVGRSRQNWIFDLAVTQPDGIVACEPLILRSDPEGGLVDSDRKVEYELLRALGLSDVPSPEVRWLDARGDWFGRPALIMLRAPGVCDYLVLNGEQPLERRAALARRFCDLLAQVHAVDWVGLGLADVLPDAGDLPSLTQVRHWEDVLRRDQLEAVPELDLAVEWLLDNAPIPERVVLVHADFKPGNILLEGDRIAALLDWELAHLGDPLEDLGWVTQPLRTREHLISGAWDRHDLVNHYRELTGDRVDDAALTWWTVFATFKTAVMQVSGLRAFLEGRSNQPYRPTRRVLKTLLSAIDGRSV